MLRLLPGRRAGGRPRLGQPEDRRDRRPRLDRRLRRRRTVQLRLAGAPPARLLVQDLRPDHGDQAGDRPRHHLLRRHLAEDPGRCPAAAPGPSTTPRATAAAPSRWPTRPVHSVNVVFAQLDLDVGPENVTQTARGNGDRTRALESVPAEGIGGLAEGRHAAGNGRRLRDPRQRRHPPRPDRDQQSRIPQRQGRRIRRRRRRTGADRGPGLRSDADPRGRDHLRAPAPATPRSAAPPRPARPAPPRKSPTPGSSATRRCSRPRSGSATRSRANTPATAARPPARSGSQLHVGRAGRRMPGIRSARQPARTLRPDSEHTSRPRATRATERRRTTKAKKKKQERGRRATKRKPKAAKKAATNRPTGSHPDPGARRPTPSAARRRRWSAAASAPAEPGSRRYSPISSIR